MARLLSIQLGTGTAKLAEIAPSGRKVSVFSAYDITLSEGLCDDGVILDVEGLADELKQYISRYAIKCNKLVFSLASKRIASKEVVIPYVKEKQIPEIIKINAPEYFPVPNIEEYALNYSILEIVAAETKQYRLSVLATPMDLLKGYEDLAKELKMSIEVIDHSGNAILQILKNQTVSTEVDAILQLNRENTVINIMAGGILVMQRNVSYGLDLILNAVGENVRLSDEDEILAFVEDNDIARICQAYPDVNDIVMGMMTSVSRIFEFYNTRAGEHQISSIKYVGDGTVINGIGAIIEQSLQIPAEEILRLYNVDVKSKTLTPEKATNFMSNIGAVIKPVGLKYSEPGAEGEKKEASGKLPIWMIIVAAAAAVIMVAASFALYMITESKHEALKRQADALAPMIKLETRLNDTLEVADVIDGFYQSTKGANDSIYRLITDLEKILPYQMSIDTFSVNNGVVTINGGGIGKKSVAKIITELKDLKYVDNVYVDYLSEVDDLQGKYDSFTLSFTLADINAIEFEEQQALENGESESIEIDMDEGGEQ